MEAKSEFGKGLVICLVKFAEHSMQWWGDKALWEEMRGRNPEIYTESKAIELHFNGASDHLSEIEVPKEWEDSEIAEKVRELKDRGFAMGYSRSGQTWAEKDLLEVYALCREIALLIDRKIGLEADEGKW